MGESESLAFDPSSFGGQVRLFPLPNLVLFPHVMQPLHIYEPRYRALVEDALAGDRLMAMGLLAPGWEPHYEGRPPLWPTACLGRIATCKKVEPDRYNLLLLGLRRVKLLDELPPERLYREARVELVEDRYPVAAAAQRAQLQEELVAAFRRALPGLAESNEQLDQLLRMNVPLGMLTDVAAYALELELPVKLQLLAQCDVDARARSLIGHLGRLAPDQPPQRRIKFPLEFSPN
jgi:ATP-dependent Lon protease